MIWPENAPFGLEACARPGGSGAFLRENALAEEPFGARFVKIDYLFGVNDTVAQAVLEASSRFSTRTGGWS